MAERIAAVTAAVAEASEARGAVVQAKKAEKVATEGLAETEVVATVDPPPRVVSVSALCPSAEEGGGQVVAERQQPCWRRFQCQVIYK